MEGGRERRGEKIQRTRGEVMKEKTERYECDKLSNGNLVAQ